MNYKEMNGKTIKEAFDKFNKENPHVYHEFKEQVFKAVKKGRKKLSAKLIINWLRWNKIINTTGKPYKINDAFQSYYARHFLAEHPELDGIFELRRLRNEDKQKKEYDSTKWEV